jgi:hypothetical protein
MYVIGINQERYFAWLTVVTIFIFLHQRCSSKQAKNVVVLSIFL